MTYYSDLVKPLSKQHDSSQSIILEILHRTCIYISFVPAESSVIVSESGYSCLGECISYYSKRLMLKDFLIPVLLTASGHHDHDRSLSRRSFRKSECTFQDDITIIEGYLLRNIWERSLWSLRTIQLRLTRGKIQRQRCTHLCKCTHHLVYKPLTFIAGTKRRDLHNDLSSSSPLNLCWDPFDTLVRRIHSRLFIIKMKHNRKLDARNLYLSRPCTCLCICHCHSCQQHRSHYHETSHIVEYIMLFFTNIT